MAGERALLVNFRLVKTIKQASLPAVGISIFSLSFYLFVNLFSFLFCQKCIFLRVMLQNLNKRMEPDMASGRRRPCTWNLGEKQTNREVVWKFEREISLQLLYSMLHMANTVRYIIRFMDYTLLQTIHPSL